jgi:hypothetical protein
MLTWYGSEKEEHEEDSNPRFRWDRETISPEFWSRVDRVF